MPDDTETTAADATPKTAAAPEFHVAIAAWIRAHANWVANEIGTRDLLPEHREKLNPVPPPAAIPNELS